jgi:hypothetical protein
MPWADHNHLFTLLERVRARDRRRASQRKTYATGAREPTIVRETRAQSLAGLGAPPQLATDFAARGGKVISS